MQFCPKCGSVIMGKDCVRCDYKSEEEVKLETSQIIESIKEIVVVEDGIGEVHPVIQMTCKKCKHPESYFWTRQTRSSDEAETKFFKCVKCKYVWREYK